MPLSQSQLKELARHGAAVVIKELEAQIAAIRAAFPDLAGRRRERNAGRPAGTRNGTGRAGRRKRSNMSAAARKAVSERMKKYWAARRAAKKAAKK